MGMDRDRSFCRHCCFFRGRRGSWRGSADLRISGGNSPRRPSESLSYRLNPTSFRIQPTASTLVPYVLVFTEETSLLKMLRQSTSLPIKPSDLATPTLRSLLRLRSCCREAPTSPTASVYWACLPEGPRPHRSCPGHVVPANLLGLTPLNQPNLYPSPASLEKAALTTNAGYPAAWPTTAAALFPAHWTTFPRSLPVPHKDGKSTVGGRGGGTLPLFSAECLERRLTPG